VYEKTRFSNCSICDNFGYVSDHHIFPQRQWARKLYGDLLDDNKNLVKAVCVDCHSRLKHITETEFCKRLNIELRSKKVNKF